MLRSPDASLWPPLQHCSCLSAPPPSCQVLFMFEPAPRRVSKPCFQPAVSSARHRDQRHPAGTSRALCCGNAAPPRQAAANTSARGASGGRTALCSEEPA